MKKYFFDQDESCHWYMIPSERRDEWQKAKELDLETDEGYGAWEAGNWENYMTGGGISQVDFNLSDEEIKALKF